MCHQFQISSSPGPLTPIRHNPEFPPGIEGSFLTELGPHADPRAGDFFLEEIFLPLSTLIAQRTDRQVPLWSYMQLRHFLTDPRTCPAFLRKHLQFESLCTNPEPQRHLISIIYSILFDKHDPKSNIASEQWEKDLSINLSDVEWGKVYANIHKGSINVTAQEKGFKLFSSWYKTPLKLHKINLEIPPTCWRCHPKEGSLLHIWCECPSILKFWTDIFCLISQITTLHIDFSPAQALLHHSSLPMKTYNRSLALHLLKAAKLYIPVLWKSPNPHTIADWIKRVNKIATIEELVHQAHYSSTTYRDTWACWQHFQTTSEYTQLLR